MSNQKVESLEALISKISYEIVSEGILEETEINKNQKNKKKEKKEGK